MLPREVRGCFFQERQFHLQFPVTALQFQQPRPVRHFQRQLFPRMLLPVCFHPESESGIVYLEFAGHRSDGPREVDHHFDCLFLELWRIPFGILAPRHLIPHPFRRRSYWIPVRKLRGTSERAGQAGDRDLQLDMAWLVASRAWLVDPAPSARRVLIEAANRLGDPESADLRILAIQAYADPLGKAPAILERRRAAAADLRHDTDAARFLGPAAVAVGAFDIAATFLGEAVEGLRTQGRLGHLPRMLTLQGNMAAQVADW